MMIFHSPRGKKMSFWDVCNGDSESREKNFALRSRKCSPDRLFRSRSDNVIAAVLDRRYSSLSFFDVSLGFNQPPCADGTTCRQERAGEHDSPESDHKRMIDRITQLYARGRCDVLRQIGRGQFGPLLVQ